MIENIKKGISNQHIRALILFVLAVLSFVVISRIVTAPSFNENAIRSLDDKKVVVMSLVAVSASSSTALTLVPGDVATPIANQLAELSSYFIIILGAIFLEKALLGAIGYLSFSYIIPAACIMGIIYVYLKKELFLTFAVKLAILGIVLFAAIPISLSVSDVIYSSYQASVEQTVETTGQNNEYIEEKKNDIAKEDNNWIENIGDYLSDITSKIGIGISDIVQTAENTLSNLIDTIVVLIITSCVMPLLVILIFVGIIKILFGFDLTKGLRNRDSNVETSKPQDKEILTSPKSNEIRR